MTIEMLQKAMIDAMKDGRKSEKTALSGYIATIKTSAINKGCRDNITEEFVNAELIKIKKSVKEQIDTCPSDRTDLMEKYLAEYEVIKAYAPDLINTLADIHAILDEQYDGPITKKDLMKWLNANYRGRMDMSVASRVVDGMIAGGQPSTIC